MARCEPPSSAGSTRVRETVPVNHASISVQKTDTRDPVASASPVAPFLEPVQLRSGEGFAEQVNAIRFVEKNNSVARRPKVTRRHNSTIILTTPAHLSRYSSSYPRARRARVGAGLASCAVRA